MTDLHGAIKIANNIMKIADYSIENNTFFHPTGEIDKGGCIIRTEDAKLLASALLESEKENEQLRKNVHTWMESTFEQQKKKVAARAQLERAEGVLRVYADEKSYEKVDLPHAFVWAIKEGWPGESARRYFAQKASAATTNEVSASRESESEATATNGSEGEG